VVVEDEAWALESQLISQIDLLLNLDQNRHIAFHSRLKELRGSSASTSAGVAYQGVGRPTGHNRAVAWAVWAVRGRSTVANDDQ
jgi:hypothetical protein